MLTERQKSILRIIVDDYVRSAEPVGSRTLSKHAELGYSAATIRNEMADLEELGYLEQPHTSAGRIPSQAGYRYYVDHLLSLDVALRAQDVEEIKQLFATRVFAFEQAAQQVAHVLSSLTQYTGVVLGAKVYDTTLKSLQLIPLTDQSAVVLVINSAGQVQNKTVTIPDGVSMHEVVQLTELMNRSLCGTPMYRIRSRVYEELMREVARHMEDYEEASRLLDQILKVTEEPQEPNVFLGQATNMLLQPEFQNIHKAKSVLSWLEKRDEVVVSLAKNALHENLRVRIGGENEVESLQDCTLITTALHIGQVPIGVVGVVGPTRMEYGRVIALLRTLSSGLSDVYGRIYSGHSSG
ncbi:heat-inducible transcriptional repressor HrcA [Ferroacidibacillus organovorans]|uniref:Heat-inducible transcription repressor HrcA n=1 Tax=Ferroacidibacillus organovorans TaxID=1765683 RepID=A0A124IWH2_9BACL|nr:heat-inducible transcriptional repressor HrcA [Ferroacidibacillus organovorans]KUO97381.1 hypothetical protein ATW55_05800 [Ferroacidibacillus organovorans]